MSGVSPSVGWLCIISGVSLMLTVVFLCHFVLSFHSLWWLLVASHTWVALPHPRCQTGTQEDSFILFQVSNCLLTQVALHCPTFLIAAHWCDIICGILLLLVVVFLSFQVSHSHFLGWICVTLGYHCHLIEWLIMPGVPKELNSRSTCYATCLIVTNWVGLASFTLVSLSLTKVTLGCPRSLTTTH